MDDIKRALLGDHEAAKRLTDEGVLVPCPWCNGNKKKETNHSQVGFWVFCIECGADGPTAGNEYEARLAWNTRAPILSKSELKKLEETT